MPLRRGLLVDVRRAFALAMDMCGGAYPPQDIQQECTRLQHVREEVLALMRVAEGAIAAARCCVALRLLAERRAPVKAAYLHEWAQHVLDGGDPMSIPTSRQPKE